MKEAPQQSAPLGLSRRVSLINGCSRATLWLILLSYLILAGCSNRAAFTVEPPGRASQTEIGAITLPPTTVAALSASPTASLTPVDTPTQTIQPSPPTPTITITPSITPSPTSEFPVARILMQAFCRYGPAKAYLYSHGLYEGDLAEIH